MARALAWINGTTHDDPAASWTLRMGVTYVGSDVEAGSYETTVEITVLFGDSLAQMRDKITSAVVATAARVPNASGGAGVTQARGQMLIPTMQLGQ